MLTAILLPVYVSVGLLLWEYCDTSGNSTGRLFNPAFPLFVEVEEEPGIYADRTMASHPPLNSAMGRGSWSRLAKRVYSS